MNKTHKLLFFIQKKLLYFPTYYFMFQPTSTAPSVPTGAAKDVPKAPIPTEHQVLQTQFDGLVKKCEASATTAVSHFFDVIM